MKDRDYTINSSVRRALDVIGDRWTLLIILGAFYGFERFDDWMRQYGMSSSVLSRRLSQLVSDGILAKQQVEAGVRRYRYILTRKGLDLFPWGLAAWKWEDCWIHQPDGHPVKVLHKDCGKLMSPQFICVHCKKEILGNDIKLEKGPGFSHRPKDLVKQIRRSTVTADVGARDNYMGHIADVVGDRWSFLVLTAAYLGIRRFDDFQSYLDIATNILSDRLRRFVDEGFLAKHRYSASPARWEYILTQKSESFFSIPLMLAQWGDKWLAPKAGVPVVRYHTVCGNKLEATAVCNHCEGILSHENVQFVTQAQVESN